VSDAGLRLYGRARITDSLKGYRSFEFDANITNRSDKPVEILLKPARWVITDGTRDMISDLAWEYVPASSTKYAYRQVDDVWKLYALPKDQTTQWQEQGKTVTLHPASRWPGPSSRSPG